MEGWRLYSIQLQQHDQSNPSTPFKPFRMPSLTGPPDDNIDEHDGNSLLFDEPIPRKRK
ncbi:hypothetical protein M9458_037906, partial [Cirrhinus mrigala]